VVLSIEGRKISPGTPIATFNSDGRYPGSTGKLNSGAWAHTAIFLGYARDSTGKIKGIYVLDQYSVAGGQKPSIMEKSFDQMPEYASITTD
jgi:hypothetical protein